MREWSEVYNIGETTIDDHHKEVFELVHMLDDAVESQDDSKLEKLIQFLEVHLLEHFEEEEALMMQSEEYSQKVFHETEHEIFRARVVQLRELFNQGGSRAHLIFTARQFVDRLINHIIAVDSGLGEIIENV